MSQSQRFDQKNSRIIHAILSSRPAECKEGGCLTDVKAKLPPEKMRASGLRSQEQVGPVPGTRITDEQVCLYMNIRKNKSQELAAARAGIGERSARRIESSVTLPYTRLLLRDALCLELPW